MFLGSVHLGFLWRAAIISLGCITSFRDLPMLRPRRRIEAGRPEAPSEASSSPGGSGDDHPLLGSAVIKEEQRKRARLFVSREKSAANREMSEIADALRQTITVSLKGDSGSKSKAFLTALTPEKAAHVFKFAEDGGLCSTAQTAQTTTITFTCLPDLLAALNKDVGDFTQFGYVR